MNGSLFEGDYVVVNKLAYGPRLPFTPLSFSVGGSKKYLHLFNLSYHRLFGYSTIKRNDVIAFNFDLTDEDPVDMREELVKRCVALPGDTLQIINGKLYVNASPEEIPTIYNNYYVETVAPFADGLLEQLNIIPDPHPELNNYYISMSTEQAGLLLKTRNIKSIKPDIQKKDFYHPVIFPNNSSIAWNLDFFGPLWIPKKGDSIVLNLKNIKLYQHTIERFENKTLELKDSVVLINQQPAEYFTFKNNYYFVLGDNRHNSIDSRNSGFIPESHIIGKASFLLFSVKNKNRSFLQVK